MLASAVDAGAVVFAVCAGYQVIGRSFPGADGSPIPGSGCSTWTRSRDRGAAPWGAHRQPVGGARGVDGSDPVVLGTLSGFENHSAVTRLGAGVRPLARVLHGVGNGAGDGTEGARSGFVLGTYAHGPALARNPALADLLLAWATGSVPAALDDVEERRLARRTARRRRCPRAAPGAGSRSDAVRRLRSLVRLRRV